MKSYPITCPAVSARMDAWQDWLSGASDLELVECWQAATSQDEDRIRDAAWGAMAGRFAMRTVIASRTVKLSPIHIKHVCAV